MSEIPVQMAQKLVTENAELAVGLIIGAAAYAFAKPYIDQYLGFVPEVIRPGAVGVLAALGGYYSGQKWLIGVGGGMVAFNVYQVTAPLAANYAVQARQLVEGTVKPMVR